MIELKPWIRTEEVAAVWELLKDHLMASTQVTHEYRGRPHFIFPHPFHFPPTVLVVWEKVSMWVVELENSMDTYSYTICWC